MRSQTLLRETTQYGGACGMLSYTPHHNSLPRMYHSFPPGRLPGARLVSGSAHSPPFFPPSSAPHRLAAAEGRPPPFTHVNTHPPNLYLKRKQTVTFELIEACGSRSKENPDPARVSVRVRVVTMAMSKSANTYNRQNWEQSVS